MRRLIYSIIAGTRRGSLTVWRDREGAAALMMAMALPALVAFTALAIDMSYAYWTRTQLQHAASAAALAGASQLNDPTDASAAAKAEAILYADGNLPTGLHGTTLVAADVTLGNWDPDTRTFTPMTQSSGVGNACDNPAPQESNPNCLTIDAVQAVTRKAQANGNPLNLFLASVIGLAQTDINTSAIAWSAGGGGDPVSETNCYNNGMLAGSMVRIQGANAFGDDFCVYGECGMEISQDNSFTEGTQVAVGPVNAATCDALPPFLDASPGENCDPDTGLDCLYDPGVYQGNYEPPGLRPEIALEWSSAPGGVFPAMEFSDDPVLPNLAFALDAVTLAPIDNMDPGSWDKDRWKDDPPCTSTGQITEYYVVNDKTDITGPMNICDVAIIADEINVGEGNLDNVLLVARAWGDNCDWSENGIADVSDECFKDANINFNSDSSMINVTLLARGNISFQSYTQLGGTACVGETTAVEVFAMGDIEIQSNATITNATIAAGHDVIVQSNATINLSGVDTTIQALNDVTLQSDGNLGACPDEDGDGGNDSEDETESVVLRLVD